jgi:four helix bundle protein
MRDPNKLDVYKLAQTAAVEVYRITRRFPADERFGLTAQMRRAAVSVLSNIAEGCARDKEADYLRFLDIAYGSASELNCQVSLARLLEFIHDDDYATLSESCTRACKALNGLIRALRGKP